MNHKVKRDWGCLQWFFLAFLTFITLLVLVTMVSAP